ncbi:VOC family protein [Occultella kanbiaonis]|uniref:VOC family protein n=1 Tax=Occultella kanbiaonis TaxID=2675754 RepID=UPI0012B94DF6|nr:VOC family protein [Occultella kanbiaonis]
MTTLDSLMLGTTDRDRLHAWYTSVLPPERADQAGPYWVLDYGGFYLFLDARDDVQPANPDPARILLNFDVTDARAAVERIEAAGGTWVAPLEDRDGSLFATTQDPDGNYVQIIQVSPSERATMEAGGDTNLPAGMLPSQAFSGFAAPDTAVVATFYRDVLGLRVDGEPGDIISLVLGHRKVVVYPKPDHVPATYTILNLPSIDIESTVRDLTARGVVFERYDGAEQDELGIHRGGGPLIAWFTDPAGNIISVLQD